MTTEESRETEAIDPVISEPTAEVSLIPVVRSSSETESEEEDSGRSFGLKNITESIASSWHASAEAEAALDWEEGDVEAAQAAVEEDHDAGRHEFIPDPAFEQPYGETGQTPAAPSEPAPITGDWSQTEVLGPQIPTGSTESTSSAGGAGQHGSGTVASADSVAYTDEPVSQASLPLAGAGSEGAGAVASTSTFSAPQLTPGPSTPLSAAPVRRKSVLRPSRIKPKLDEALRKADALRKGTLFDRRVFDQKVKPQQVFRKIMQPEQPTTGSVSIIDRLAGTPYANPYVAEQHADNEELATISFVLDLGEALFRYGAGALEVETSIIAVTAAFGMKNTDVDITNQSISLNWAPEGHIPYSRVRVVRSWSSNYKALASVHQLVTDIISGRMTRGEAEQRLREITREPKPYPRWMVTLCGGIFASAFASFLGAPWLDALLGFAATIIVLWVTRQLAAWRVPEYFCLAAGGFLATFIAMGAFTLDVPITPSMVVAGGLMILLPSARVVSAIQDAINGFPITSAGRMMSAMIAFAGMTSGIMAAVVLADLLGAPPMEIAVGLTRIYPPAALVALVFLAAMAAAVVEQARWRMVLPTAAVSALGFAAFYAGELLGLGERITPVIGATVVGALGRAIALRMGAPQLVIAVPAMMFMLPGLMVFRGMYQIAMGSTADFMMAGLSQLFNALIIILAIAAGIVLGDVAMRPFTSGLPSNEGSSGARRR